jgi:hypothetical protein
MEDVVGSIPTRSTNLSTTRRYPPFELGASWCQNALTLRNQEAVSASVGRFAFSLHAASFPVELTQLSLAIQALLAGNS